MDVARRLIWKISSDDAKIIEPGLCESAGGGPNTHLGSVLLPLLGRDTQHAPLEPNYGPKYLLKSMWCMHPSQ